MDLIFQPPPFQPFITDMHAPSPPVLCPITTGPVPWVCPLLSGWGGSYFYSVNQAPLSTVQRLNLRKGDEALELSAQEAW